MFSILAYNTHLATNSIDVDFIKYIKDINSQFNFNVNLKLLELSEYSNKNECCMNHSVLYDFEVLKYKKGKQNIDDVKNILKKYKEGEHFIVRNVSYIKKNKVKTKKEFYIHPNVFKKILISTNDKYMDYFIFIDNCMHYYSDYKKKNTVMIRVNSSKTLDSQQ